MVSQLKLWWELELGYKMSTKEHLERGLAIGRRGLSGHLFSRLIAFLSLPHVSSKVHRKWDKIILSAGKDKKMQILKFRNHLGCLISLETTMHGYLPVEMLQLFPTACVQMSASNVISNTYFFTFHKSDSML